MKRTLLAALLLSLAQTAFAQFIEIDKTDRYGRLISTDFSEIYEHSGREGEFALSFFQSEEGGSYCLLFKSQEDFNIRVGDKMLLKHENGMITEIECVDDGEKSTHVSSFGLAWLSPYPEFYRSTDGVVYSITEEQLKDIISSPVQKIRIEEATRYTDRKVGTSRGKSQISSFVEGAFSKIQTALKEKKTGLYDGF